jgi:nitroreductase
VKNPFRTVWRSIAVHWDIRRVFHYDRRRFVKNAGVAGAKTRDARRAEIIMGYHVLEKGLSMPARRPAFGRWAVLHLIDLLERWRASEGDFADGQVRHAARVLLAYEKLHRELNWEESADPKFWQRLHAFTAGVPELSPAVEPRMTRERLYSARNASFPQFAASRRSLRSFTGEGIPVATLREAVELAMTAPSACNRQHARVHAVTAPALRKELLAIQQGCRGFGEKASAFLVVTASLGSIVWCGERNDVYVNAGIFLMNLSYALHWHEVAHCILNWSVEPERDRKLRRLLALPEEEEIVALVACGRAAEEFDTAASPRRMVEEIFTEHGGR